MRYLLIIFGILLLLSGAIFSGLKEDNWSQLLKITGPILSVLGSLALSWGSYQVGRRKIYQQAFEKDFRRAVDTFNIEKQKHILNEWENGVEQAIRDGNDAAIYNTTSKLAPLVAFAVPEVRNQFAASIVSKSLWSSNNGLPNGPGTFIGALCLSANSIVLDPSHAFIVLKNFFADASLEKDLEPPEVPMWCFGIIDNIVRIVTNADPSTHFFTLAAIFGMPQIDLFLWKHPWATEAWSELEKLAWKNLTKISSQISAVFGLVATKREPLLKQLEKAVDAGAISKADYDSQIKFLNNFGLN